MTPFETKKVPTDESLEQIKCLFGSLANAAKILGLTGVPAQVLREALNGSPVAPKYADEILAAWSTWKRDYLHSSVRGSRDFKQFNWTS